MVDKSSVFSKISLSMISSQLQPSVSDISKFINDPTMVDVYTQYVSLLHSDLNMIQENCKQSDRYLNPARYTCMCHAVFRARIFLLLVEKLTTDSSFLKDKLDRQIQVLHEKLKCCIDTFELQFANCAQ